MILRVYFLSGNVFGFWWLGGFGGLWLLSLVAFGFCGFWPVWLLASVAFGFSMLFYILYYLFIDISIIYYLVLRTFLVKLTDEYGIHFYRDASSIEISTFLTYLLKYRLKSVLRTCPVNISTLDAFPFKSLHTFENLSAETCLMNCLQFDECS